jgi:hypothetical protein
VGWPRLTSRDVAREAGNYAGHASKHWLEFFSGLVSLDRHQLHAEAEDREDRAWVIVWLPSAGPDFHPEPMLDAARARRSS